MTVTVFVIPPHNDKEEEKVYAATSQRVAAAPIVCVKAASAGTVILLSVASTQGFFTLSTNWSVAVCEPCEAVIVIV